MTGSNKRTDEIREGRPGGEHDEVRMSGRRWNDMKIERLPEKVAPAASTNKTR